MSITKYNNTSKFNIPQKIIIKNIKFIQKV